MPDSKPALTPQQELTVVAGLLNQVGHLTVSTAGIELLGCLIDGPRDVGTLAHMTDTAIASVSKKLAELRHAGLVSCHIEGSRHVYQLAENIKVISWDDNRVVVAKVPGGMLAVGISREILDRIRHVSGPPAFQIEVRPHGGKRSAVPAARAAPGNTDSISPV